MSILRQLLVVAVIAGLAYTLWDARDLGLLRLAGLERDAAGADGSGAALTPESEGAPVLVSGVEFRRDRTVIEAVGDGLALKAVTLYSSVSGEVTDVSFKAGERVAAGEALVRLDDRREQLALDLALVAVKDAEQTLERFERAVRTGAVSQSEVDAARTALERARLERDQAEVALEDRTIEAPFDGVVGIPRIEPGDRVTSETLLTTLDDRSALLVDFDLPEIYLGRLALDMPVQAGAWSLPEQTFYGRLSALESRVDASTRTIRARARLPNAGDRLRPGMSFTIFIELPGRDYVSVPETAVQWGREGAYLWRAADGRAEKVFVEIVKRGEGRILIDAPLGADDEIVVEGVQRMREGVRLSVSGRIAAEAEAEKPTPAAPAEGGS
ncbi:MAG: efflux RND transporter periplasmic adaptor subunit [Marivibrio sp.]|uniref:efflux RND transporter periplasmic adaptor subunit n=1 Tax=Marivibrio sp. TaxID=2039719 RepID=UPI0032EE4285